MKTVLVTGASSGMGKATALKLLSDGHRVYAAARRVEQMRDLEQRGAILLEMDVTNDEQVVSAVNRITAEHGGVDVLVNNAGFGLYGAMEDTTIADARYQFEVNVFGVARLTQLVLPYMREKGAGTIINVSSVGGKIYTPLGSWYHASKHAIEGWSDSLRLELEQFGIHVIIVEPGFTATEFSPALLDPMLARSGKGAYATFTAKIAAATVKSNESGGGSSPAIIADVIAHAIAVKRPKTRYAAGRLARPLILARKLVGDRVFDRIVMSQY
jgi:NAD(P)-dependent dehydrogenase (short-subunit alcohol dehydrogenase family)